MENKPEKIVITGEISRVDEGAREYLSILDRRIETINERTKSHTLRIKELEKKLKDETQLNNKEEK